MPALVFKYWCHQDLHFVFLESASESGHTCVALHVMTDTLCYGFVLTHHILGAASTFLGLEAKLAAVAVRDTGLCGRCHTGVVAVWTRLAHRVTLWRAWTHQYGKDTQSQSKLQQ